MEMTPEEWVQTYILRVISELMKVGEQLKMSNEAGSLPGDKMAWCIDKINSVMNDLGHINEIVKSKNEIEICDKNEK